MIIQPVILCGGSGTRLWPLSRQSMPKQFSAFLGEKSLFQGAVTQLANLNPAPAVIVTGSDYRFIVREQLETSGIAAADILVEPSAKNTAPAGLAAALHIAKTNPDAVMVVMPSDHVVPDSEAFAQAVSIAAQAAAKGHIVTFGITPDRAETGYGWLELAASPQAGDTVLPLRAFVEKPPLARAEEMLAAGRYFWNAGIFVMSAKAFIDTATRLEPGMVGLVNDALAAARSDLGFLRLAAEPWAALAAISIDYAIMEKTAGLLCVPFAGRWSDLGDWNAVWREMDKDPQGVISHGAATAIDCTNSLLWSDDGDTELVGIGLNNLIAVAVDGAVLVADRSRGQDVRLVVSVLKAKGSRHAEASSRDHRPWGWFETLALADNFQVKRIVVKPGARLSLQSHTKRAEHWVVVNGIAEVTLGETVSTLSANQSVYVPLGEKHRLANPGSGELVLIEVQTGTYLGEDDIIRHDDIYARDQGAKG